jgi:hypothetical protein
VQPSTSGVQRSTTQVEDSGLQKRSESVGKGEEKSLFPVENLQKSMGIESSIPGQKISGFFRRLLAVSHWKEQELDQKTLENPKFFRP